MVARAQGASMSLASMTGFARADGGEGLFRFAWEARSVNSKGLDIRLRLPPGFDALEPALRADVAARFSRGSVSATLTTQRGEQPTALQVNEPLLGQLLALSASLGQQYTLEPPRLDGLLAIRGVLEFTAGGEPDDRQREHERALVRTGFVAALDGLWQARATEGSALGSILEERLAEIDALRAAAEQNPARRPEAVRARLQAQLAGLFDADQRLEPDRLHQEAVLLALRADIREELDRLAAHVAQARELLARGGAIGRRLDFLAQELGRESNTLCSKSNDLSLTAIGLDLKAAVEQFREQVQNLE
jgi:uncharacterized protein (TIGR00255 family)